MTHSPDKLFDKLPETFDKLKLVALFFVLLSLVIASKRYAQYKAKFKKYPVE